MTANKSKELHKAVTE